MYYMHYMYNILHSKILIISRFQRASLTPVLLDKRNLAIEVTETVTTIMTMMTTAARVRAMTEFSRS